MHEDVLHSVVVLTAQAEFEAVQHGYTATRHQREVGTGYFDQVAEVISGGLSSTRAMADSTEQHQF